MVAPLAPMSWLENAWANFGRRDRTSTGGASTPGGGTPNAAPGPQPPD